jgi:hypothetical protein
MINYLQPTTEETALYNEVDELLKEAVEIITQLKSYKGKQPYFALCMILFVHF